MKNLYLYDDKHDRVLAEMQITDVGEAKRIMDFLAKNNVTNRYCSLVIADSVVAQYNEEDDYTSIDFIGKI